MIQGIEIWSSLRKMPNHSLHSEYKLKANSNLKNVMYLRLPTEPDISSQVDITTDWYSSLLFN